MKKKTPTLAISEILVSVCPTPPKTDTSLRQTVGDGPNSVRLRESLLTRLSLRWTVCAGPDGVHLKEN